MKPPLPEYPYKEMFRRKAGLRMFGKSGNRTLYIDAQNPAASELLARRLQRCIRSAGRNWRELVFLCIGSDSITGDSLGPLVGGELFRQRQPGFFVYGTPEQPVHAMNLSEQLADLSLWHPRALVVAVDASLGNPRHQQHISVGKGSIRPGAGAGKVLPDVGDIFITGIVSSFEKNSHRELQAVDFSDILRLSDTISRGILSAWEKLLKSRKSCLPEGSSFSWL